MILSRWDNPVSRGSGLSRFHPVPQGARPEDKIISKSLSVFCLGGHKLLNGRFAGQNTGFGHFLA